MADATTTPAPPEAPAAEAAESVYDVKIEDGGPATKRLTITVPADIINDKIRDSMGTLATQTTLPGFRKGKAPKALLERRFGTAVRSETRNQVIADAYSSAVQQHKLKPVGEPEPTTPLDEIELHEGEPLTFTVEVEVVPVFELPDLSSIKVKKPMFEITDEHIEQELLRYRTQMGEIITLPASDKPQEGDRILGPGTATKVGEDEPFFSHDNVDIVVPGAENDGRGHVLGLIIEGLAGILKGKKVGDSIHIETVGPESHELEDIRGEKLVIDITIREVQRILPADIETVIERSGLESEEVVREQIRISLEYRVDQEQRNAMREQVLAHLRDAVDFELPKKLSANQTARLIERQRYEMMYRGGKSTDEVEGRLAEMRAETEIESAARLKLTFILHALAEHFEVQVTPQEVNGRIAQIAQQRGERPEQLRGQIQRAGAMGQIASQVREHKALDRVIDQATVTEIPVDEWNKSVEEKKGASSKKTGSKKTSSSKKTTTKKKSSTKKSSTK